MPTSALSSRDKKRLRDRRAQNARRARRDAYILSLEQQAETCQQQHGHQVEHLRSEIYTLQCENAELRRRLQLRGDDDDCHCHAERPAGDDGLTPTWAQTPKSLRYDETAESLSPWLLCPAVVSSLSDTPSVTDLLYGTRDGNPLSHSLHIAVSYHYSSGKLRPPERLALSWLAYVYTRWALDPSPARYNRLPIFLRPTELQKWKAHSGTIDLLLWPEMRDELVRTADTPAQLQAAIGSYVATIRLDWPVGAPIVETANGGSGQLVITQAFMDTFFDLENWSVGGA